MVARKHFPGALLMPRAHGFLAIAVSLLSFATPTFPGAATTEVVSGRSGSTPIIFVRGDLEPGDEKRFIERALGVDRAVVVLESDGGSLLAGIQIGKAIRLKEFSTAVLNGTRCASACALAWLGGVVRFIDATAKVGFHAAYERDGDHRKERGGANALAGAYLHGLGLSSRAVYFIMNTPADSITWLSLESAGQHGIEVRPLRQEHAGGRQSKKPPGARERAPSERPSSPGPPVVLRSERAIYYEEDPTNPQVPNAISGRVIWRSEMAAAGRRMDPIVRAVIEIPDAALVMNLRMLRNEDASLPASHTLELSFSTEKSRPERAVRDLGLPQFKDEEASRGTPIAGVPVRVRENIFLVGLSRLDERRNRELVLRRKWMDLPVRLASGTRGIISVEKGPSGEELLRRAFETWSPSEFSGPESPRPARQHQSHSLGLRLTAALQIRENRSSAIIRPSRCSGGDQPTRC